MSANYPTANYLYKTATALEAQHIIFCRIYPENPACKRRPPTQLTGNASTCITGQWNQCVEPLSRY